MSTTGLAPRVTQKSIFLAWLPLAAMWIFMAVEQPGIAAIIARMPEVKKQLAIFGVVFSFSLIIESPIIQMLSAGAALGTDRSNYKKLLHSMHLMGVVLTLIHVLVGVTPLFDFLILKVIGMPEDFLADSRTAFLFMSPFTASVGYRRLWQGVLIRQGQSRVIPAVMLTRLLTSACVLLLGMFFRFLPGAAVGSLALTLGVIVGALGSYAFVRRELPRMRRGEGDFSYVSLFHFYYPLALTSFIDLAARPILSVGVARAARPIESLAIWPVVMGFMFLFNSFAKSYQEIVITLNDKPGGQRELKRFALRMGLTVFISFQLVVFTPLRDLWFRYVSGLDAELMELLPMSVLFASFVPAIFSSISYNRGVLITSKRTGLVSLGVFINFISMVTFMFTLLLVPGITGATLAAASFFGAMAVEAVFLAWKRSRG
ncbi:hypothetical protein B4O97_15645 [Marispirochaeta aestuarii]|uniref:Polysaccharide biosynthesis protein C-terminal domain-containing protein n=1 Tax=Marispirochaeta aestuarii TaxID=1963862 RepID=A0A1Y1RUK2_9SPIO|nr:hypothetical protein [Marispirochaeta aestuarii]ORC32728.1 hypothetical protein B4O97_15645 [Marispirochaeta aestuarii]